MYELIQLSEHDYYIDCPAKIGLIKASDNEVVLIDSGNDKDAGKKVCRIRLIKITDATDLETINLSLR